MLWSGCSNKSEIGTVSNPSATVKELDLTEVAETFNAGKTDRWLGNVELDLPPTERKAQALLNSLGLKGNPEEILAQWQAHPVFQKLTDPDRPDWMEKEVETVNSFAKLLREPIEQSITTGYNIVPEAMWPSFDPDKTVIYGHSDWKHARQLVALLYSEGLKPRIIPLIKTSAFLYNDDWGAPSRPLEQLKSGKRLVVGEEFDLFLEFKEKPDVERFAKLVTQYAKKDSPDEPGLIYGSWWQPFYRTLSPYSEGHPLTVMLLCYKGFRANLISLPEDAPAKSARLRTMNDQWKVEEYTIWVNPGFYRSQFGEYR
jgi:hypothetical protein